MDTIRSAHPDLRVEVDVEEIDREVHEHHDEGEKEDTRLHDGKVELTDGADDEPAHPRYREYRLGDDGAAEQQAELEPRHGDQGQGGVDESVVPDDDPFGDALGSGGTHVV